MFIFAAFGYFPTLNFAFNLSLLELPFLEKQQLMNLTLGHTRDTNEKTGGNNREI